MYGYSVPAQPPGAPGPCRPSLPGTSVPIWEKEQVSEDPGSCSVPESTLRGAPQPLAQKTGRPDPPGKRAWEEA